MKRIFITLLMTALIAVSQGQIDFGLKGAVTMSNLTTDLQEIRDAARTGWQAGVFMRLGDKWHLQPEAYFTAKTGQLKYTAPDANNPLQSGDVTQDITLHAIDIPVLVGYKIIDPPTLNVRLQAGPVASFVINKKFEVSGEGIDPAEPTEDYKDSWKNANWGLQFGAGVDFLFLTADLRYELGLNNLYKPGDGAAGNESGTFKNHLFLLSVGVKIF